MSNFQLTPLRPAEMVRPLQASAAEKKPVLPPRQRKKGAKAGGSIVALATQIQPRHRHARTGGDDAELLIGTTRVL
jgi:hypothetical protein